MDCTDTRALMLSAREGRLPDDEGQAVRSHLAGCDRCRSADAVDAELSRTLRRIARAPAPPELRSRLEARYAEASPPPTRARWRPAPLRYLGAAAACAAAIAAATVLVVRSEDRSGMLFAEAVNDHLRVLYAEHPTEIESGGIHQVKPWFAGRLDFAPVVPFAGDADFPLKGGSVAYFVDRKAAAFVFGRRLHTITLLVFRADGLPWPTGVGETIAGHRTFARTSRGFHALLWRNGDLGYALVSDVAEADLRQLEERL